MLAHGYRAAGYHLVPARRRSRCAPAALGANLRKGPALLVQPDGLSLLLAVQGFRRGILGSPISVAPRLCPADTGPRLGLVLARQLNDLAMATFDLLDLLPCPAAGRDVERLT